MKKVKILSLMAVATLGAVSLGTKDAFAYENGQPDANTKQNEVKKANSATIPAEGTFEEFNPTQPTDPKDPNPDPTDKAWVDVKIPDKLLFGATDVSKGIISPSYEIENLSSKGVKVSVSDFQAGTDADKLPELTLNLENTDSKKTVALANHETDPAKAVAFPAEVGTITNQGGKINFKLSGDIGQTHDFSQSLNPKYTLVLEFEVQ